MIIDGEVKSTCGICFNNCGVLVQVESGRAVKIKGDPQSPVNQGSLCKMGLASLEYLYLTDNDLSSLPREIGGLSNLTHLYLGHNQLVELPPEMGQLANLTQLNLDRNLLTTLPDSMIFLGSLVEG